MATITVGLMSPPLESESTVTAFRLIDAALRDGHNVHVFAYEGAVGLTSQGLARHADSVTGVSLEDSTHPTTREWAAALQALAREKGVALTWTLCGVCADERGIDAHLEGAGRGAPFALTDLADASEGFLFIAAK